MRIPDAVPETPVACLNQSGAVRLPGQDRRKNGDNAQPSRHLAGIYIHAEGEPAPPRHVAPKRKLRPARAVKSLKPPSGDVL